MKGDANGERIPALRAVEVVPIRHQGRELFLLRDPQGIADEPLLLSPASVALLRFCDGRHTLRDVQLAVTRASGNIVPQEQIAGFIGKLDRHHFLDSAAFREHRAELAREYDTWSVRPARFAGNAYPRDPAQLRASIERAYTAPEGPGLPEEETAPPVAGIIAPHIDPARGGVAYAHSYRSLWGAQPQRIVLLGIAHAPAQQPFILTTKDYATPLGRAHTAQGLIERLQQRLDWDPLGEEDLHRWEHSVEFQIVHIQHALARGSASPAPQVHYLPILCAFAWEVLRGETGREPARTQIDEFLFALRCLLTEEGAGTVIVAGIDLAHWGRRFGDETPLRADLLSDLEQRDRATMALVAAGDRDGFVAEIIAEQDARRICGCPAIYALLSLLPDSRGTLHRYEQSIEEATGSVVSFAAMTFAPPRT